MTLTTLSPLIQDLNQVCTKLLSLATGETTDFPESPTRLDSDSINQPDNLCQKFKLSADERQVLLLCIAAETIPDFHVLCANAQGNPQQPYPTLALAQKLSSENDFHLLSSQSALQHWQLIHLDPGPSLSQSPIRIDPAILSYILGYPCLDDALNIHLTPIIPPPRLTPLSPSQQTVTTELLYSWTHNPTRPTQLTHPDAQTREALALAATTQQNYQLYKLHHLSLPTQPDALHTFILRWQRHTRLYPSILLIECSDLDPENPNIKAQLSQLLDRIRCPVILSAATRLRLGNALTTLEIPDLSLSEQRELWAYYLSEQANTLTHQLDQIVTTFNLTPHNIEVIIRTTLAQTQTPDDLAQHLWVNCRNQTRSQLESFAQRIDSKATWEDVMLLTQSLAPVAFQF